MASARRRTTIVIVALVLATLLGGLAGYLLTPSGPAAAEEFDAGGPPPPEAAETVRRLLSTDRAERESAVSPEALELVGRTEPLPLGTKIVLDPDGWSGDASPLASATATVTPPGQLARRVLLGFERVDGLWRLLFEEEL
ncbi:hypothetical protein NLX83_20785 [Allokutzneria sp. A3M-2-11 16]|uniref:hypothetical protein n=1 Tax=Allokutzneria sp. A3M-2-11 16 TaxID=2962043 RepID=UPI0020B8BDAB|nr:hypothetical protein [Allokutzneria sp. A3M-2-11 16]MCP3801703.1 hypothetical protein [Allokutzneria sp. A3M-2-11 16]